MLTRVTSNQWPFLFGSPEVPPKPTHSKENWHICLFYLFLAHLHIKKNKLNGPFSWMGFNCLKARATSRMQFYVFVFSFQKPTSLSFHISSPFLIIITINASECKSDAGFYCTQMYSSF